MDPITSRLLISGAAIAALVASVLAQQPPTPPAPIGTEQGFGLFQQRCLGCHGNPSVEKAASPAALRAMSPERIYDALTSGVMKTVVGDSLTDEQRRRVSESIAGRLLGTETSGDGARMRNQCAPGRSFALGGPAWNGWGAQIDNGRFQPADAARLTVDQIARLALKWAFGFPESTSSYNQPVIVGGRLFVGADTAWVYALDADSGCVHWSFRARAGVRAPVGVGTGAPAGDAMVFVGDLKANVYALDARTGRQLWTTTVDDHLTARVTAAPTLHDGRLYVPLSSWEEFSA